MTIRFSVRPAFGPRGWEVLDHSTHMPVLNSQGRVRKFKTKADAISFASASNKEA
jgi:hypothetical protein